MRLEVLNVALDILDIFKTIMWRLYIYSWSSGYKQLLFASLVPINISLSLLSLVDKTCMLDEHEMTTQPSPSNL